MSSSWGSLVSRPHESLAGAVQKAQCCCKDVGQGLRVMWSSETFVGYSSHLEITVHRLEVSVRQWWFCGCGSLTLKPCLQISTSLIVDCAHCQEASVAGAAADGIGECTRRSLCASVHARGQEHPAGEAAWCGLAASSPQAHRHVTSHLLSTCHIASSQSITSSMMANLRVLFLIHVQHPVHHMDMNQEAGTVS